MRQKQLGLSLLVLMMLGALGGGTLAQDLHENARDAVQRGNEQFVKSKYELAIQEYRRVPVNAGETYAKALYNIGVSYYELWQTEEAVAYYRKAIAASNGRYPVALHSLGVALKDLGRLPEAKKAFEQAIATSDGGYAPAHYLLGLLAMGEADHEGAAASFRRAIVHFKNRFPAGHNNLGVALARMNRLPEAKREFEIALSQAGGELIEAKQNLKLCSSLLADPKTVAALKIVDANGGQNK